MSRLHPVAVEWQRKSVNMLGSLLGFTVYCRSFES